MHSHLHAQCVYLGDLRIYPPCEAAQQVCWRAIEKVTVTLYVDLFTCCAVSTSCTSATATTHMQTMNISSGCHTCPKPEHSTARSFKGWLKNEHNLQWFEENSLMHSLCFKHMLRLCTNSSDAQPMQKGAGALAQDIPETQRGCWRGD